MTTTTPTAPVTYPVATVLAVIEAAGRAGVPVLLWGDPGLGKSSLIQALAHTAGLPCETVIGSLREPSDFAGLPIVTPSGVRFEAPAWAKRLAASEDGGYLFLDELSTATPTTQAAMLSVVLDRRVGDQPLGPRVRVLAAANPPEKAADGWDLTPPMANRFLHVDYAPSAQDWITGVTTGFVTPTPEPLHPHNAERVAVARAHIAAFIRTRPELLDDYPATATATGRAWPSRRTWTMLADVLAQVSTDDAAALAATGLVGEGPGIEYTTWRALSNLPDPGALIADPGGYDWASEPPDRVWAALNAVVGYVNARTDRTAAWREAWKPVAAAAEAGKADVAAAVARPMMLIRPPKATIPAVVKRFAPALVAAGLLPGDA